MFSCENCEILRTVFLNRTPPVAASIHKLTIIFSTYGNDTLMPKVGPDTSFIVCKIYPKTKTLEPCLKLVRKLKILIWRKHHRCVFVSVITNSHVRTDVKLTHFFPMLPFSTSWYKNVSRGKEWVHWEQIG